MLPHDSDLANLKENLLTMAGLAESAVARAVQALVERNDGLANAVIESDNQLDELEKRIDDLAIHLLSKAPLAGDLRMVTVAMKISGNLERIGDEATTIARRSVDLSEEPQLKAYVDIPRMAALGMQMMKDALDSFVHGNTDKARAVISQDRQVDEINRPLHRELASFMVERPVTITRALHLMVISKSLERVADHAKNIAEQSVFLYEAKDIRHTGGASAEPDATTPPSPQSP